MPEIANWGKHKFVVGPELIQSFKDLSIKGSVETTDKTTANQKYVERKAGEAPQVTFTVDLNALTGVKDVYGEAQQYVQDALAGKTDYFYLGPSKIIPAKLMLTTAEVTGVVFMPGKGNVWISCSVKLTMKQGAATDGSQQAPTGGSSNGVRIYYSTGSGVVRSVWGATYAQAMAKVPKNAMWAGTKPQQAQQTQPLFNEQTLAAARARAAAAAASQQQQQSAGLDRAHQIIQKPGAQAQAIK